MLTTSTGPRAIPAALLSGRTTRFVKRRGLLPRAKAELGLSPGWMSQLIKKSEIEMRCCRIER